MGKSRWESLRTRSFWLHCLVVLCRLCLLTFVFLLSPPPPEVPVVMGCGFSCFPRLCVLALPKFNSFCAFVVAALVLQSVLERGF